MIQFFDNVMHDAVTFVFTILLMPCALAIWIFTIMFIIDFWRERKHK